MQDYERLIATFQEKFDYDNVYDVIDVVTSIYGYNEKTLDNINYYLTGYNSYEQLKELEEEEKDYKRGHIIWNSLKKKSCGMFLTSA